MGNTFRRPADAVNTAVQTVTAPAQALPPELAPYVQSALAVFLFAMAFEYVQNPRSGRFGTYSRGFAENGDLWLTIGAGALGHETLGLRVGTTESTLFLAFVAFWQNRLIPMGERVS